MMLMTMIVTVAFSYLSSSSRNLKKAAFQLSRDIQSAYQKATKDSEFQRILVGTDRNTYQLQKFQAPQPRPEENPDDPENRKKVEAWDEAQREFENKGGIERTELTRLERGSFKSYKEQSLPGQIRIKTFLTARGLSKEKKEENETLSMMFFPSGEADQTLIVLDDGNDHYFSLVVNPLSGRVTSSQGEITEQEWKKSIKGG